MRTFRMQTPTIPSGRIVATVGSPMIETTEAQWAELAAAARRACANAYSPYSAFRVGAAVRSGDGAIAAGCNVESASFGLTVCAERNAVFRAIADGAREITAVALYTPTPEPSMPCGACRQVIAEFGRDANIRSFCDGPAVAKFTLGELLPGAFTLPAK